MSLFATEKKVGISAVTAAARLCEHVRQTMVIPEKAAATTTTKITVDGVMEKDDKSPVTVADYGAQAVVCAALREAFPNDPVVAEEDALALKNENESYLVQVTECVQTIIPTATPENVTSWINHGKTIASSQRFWTLDPIDGTKGYVRGDQYAVALALVDEGEVKVGVLACPALSLPGKDGSSMEGVLFVAVRGEGTTVQSLLQHNDTSAPLMHLSNSLDDIHNRLVESFELSHSNQLLQKSIAKAVGIQNDSVPLRMDSQAKYGVVALGHASVYLRLPNPQKPNYKENIWDHAAGSIIVEEAGGRVTNMHGENLNFTEGNKLTGTGVVVSKGKGLHKKILDALRT